MQSTRKCLRLPLASAIASNNKNSPEKQKRRRIVKRIRMHLYRMCIQCPYVSIYTTRCGEVRSWSVSQMLLLRLLRAHCSTHGHYSSHRWTQKKNSIPWYRSCHRQRGISSSSSSIILSGPFAPKRCLAENVKRNMGHPVRCPNCEINKIEISIRWKWTTNMWWIRISKFYHMKLRQCGKCVMCVCVGIGSVSQKSTFRLNTCPVCVRVCASESRVFCVP